MLVEYNKAGQIKNVWDGGKVTGGKKIKKKKNGPGNNAVDGINTTTIIHTKNPTCWIPTAGGWYQVPC